MFMFIRIIASVAYILILISAVEGTCTCSEVCPNFTTRNIVCTNSFTSSSRHCQSNSLDDWYCCPYGQCVCNFWGCNCEGCGSIGGGQCGCEKCTTQDCINNCNDDVPLKVRDQFRDLMEEKDTCEDYNFFMNLSLEEKKEFLGEKYCEDGTPTDDIFKKMLKYVSLVYLETNRINLDELALSCDDFNRSVYNGKDTNVSVIGRKLKLCRNKGNKKGSQKKKKTKNKKNKNKNRRLWLQCGYYTSF